MIDAPGIYDLTAAEYHADPCVAPSLSSGVAWELLTRSPLHAWAKHPRLNPDFEPDHSAKFDLGTAAHTLILGKGDQIHVIDAPDYRTKEAQGQRATAILDGKTPLLTWQYERAVVMRDRVIEQLRGHELGHVFGQPGEAEPEQLGEIPRADHGDGATEGLVERPVGQDCPPPTPIRTDP